MPLHTPEHRTVYDSLPIASVIMLLFIKPPILKTLPGWSLFFMAMAAVSVILLCVFVLEHKLVYKKHILIVFLFFFARLLTTVMNRGDIVSWGKNDGIMLGACVFFELWMEKSPKTLFRTRFVFEILIVLNLICIYIFPNGMYAGENYTRNWVLGFNNQHIRIMLPGICLSMLCSYAQHGKMTLRPLLLLAVSLFSVLKLNSSTSIIGLVFFSLLLFLFLKFDYRGILKPINLFSGTVVILAVDVAIVIAGRVEAIRPIIENILGKDVTFTGRTATWQKAIDYFLKRPVFGYGYTTGERFQRLLGDSQATHPHNYLLYLLFIGGIFLLAVFILMVSAGGKKLSASGSASSKVVLCTLLSFFVMGISESLVNTNLLYPMFVLAMNADKFDGFRPDEAGPSEES